MEDATPMFPLEGSTADVLAGQARSLRALARHLLVDPHAADDAVQETWLRALQHPPRRADGSGAWLRTVLRNVVSSQRRGQARREERERRVARAEATAVPDGRAELLRSVIDAVLGLDEPYRGTILSRYFEDLPPREIARREGVSIHTVESRLQRALAQLRARLERELGGRGDGLRALAPLAGLPLGLAPGGPALVMGTLMLTSKTWIALAASAAVLALVLAWSALSRPVSGGGLRPLAAAAGPLALADSGPSEPAQDPRAQPAGEASVVAPALTFGPVPPAPPYEFALDVQVRDRLGRPFRDQRVFLALDDRPFVMAGITDPRGQLELRWEGFKLSMQVRVASDPLHGSLAHYETLEVRHRRPHTLQLQSPSGLAPLEWDATTLDQPLQAPAVLHDLGELLGAQDCEELDGNLRAVELARDPSRGSMRLSLNPGGFLAEQSSGRQVRRPAGLGGAVLDARGNPVAGVVLVADGLAGAAGVATISDFAGLFHLNGLQPGALELTALGRTVGITRLSLELQEGELRGLDIVLGRERALHGQLLDARGEPLAGRVLEARNADFDTSLVRSTLSDARGRFSLFGFERTAELWLGEAERARPAVQLERRVRSSAREQEFRLRWKERATASMRLQVFDAAGRPFPRARVLVSQARGGGGMLAAAGILPAEFELAGLAPGTWQVEIRAPGQPALRIPAVQLEAGDERDLGRQWLAEPGHVSFVTGGEARAQALEPVEGPALLPGTLLRLGEHVESRLEGLTLASDGTCELPPGEYLWIPPEGERSDGVPLRVESGASTPGPELSR